jgi:hypothetical protein
MTDRDTCPHGRRRVARFSEKRQRYWAALMCTSKACDPVWVPDGDVFDAWQAAGERPPF